MLRIALDKFMKTNTCVSFNPVFKHHAFGQLNGNSIFLDYRSEFIEVRKRKRNRDSILKIVENDEQFWLFKQQLPQGKYEFTPLALKNKDEKTYYRGVTEFVTVN